MQNTIYEYEEIKEENYKELRTHIIDNSSFRYFMKIEKEDDLEFVKEYKIKPLLEEYFYGDEENYEKAITILELKNEPNKQ